jgi:hypothetical protein
MKNSAFESFSESAQDALDFARCQRPDGSFYGTGGQCRKGSPAGAKEKEAKLSPTQEARQSKDPTVQSRVIKSDIKKLSKEYEKLRGKPEAAARRSAIMKEVSSLVNKQADLLKKQGPAKAPDTSPAANQRRANAAARAKD